MRATSFARSDSESRRGQGGDGGVALGSGNRADGSSQVSDQRLRLSAWGGGVRRGLVVPCCSRAQEGEESEGGTHDWE